MSKHCPCESCIYYETEDCDYFREIRELQDDLKKAEEREE